mmetsp:Transcript_14772/g.27841  ORF Transcript_14772/g.27841 Transcript_14772/m.27841 type:complete len:247 (+) Transcript_14772:2485-3225(+)
MASPTISTPLTSSVRGMPPKPLEKRRRRREYITRSRKGQVPGQKPKHATRPTRRSSRPNAPGGREKSRQMQTMKWKALSRRIGLGVTTRMRDTGRKLGGSRRRVESRGHPWTLFSKSTATNASRRTSRRRQLPESSWRKRTRSKRRRRRRRKKERRLRWEMMDGVRSRQNSSWKHTRRWSRALDFGAWWRKRSPAKVLANARRSTTRFFRLQAGRSVRETSGIHPRTRTRRQLSTKPSPFPRAVLP